MAISPSNASSFGDISSSPTRWRHEQNRVYTIVSSAEHKPYVNRPHSSCVLSVPCIIASDEVADQKFLPPSTYLSALLPPTSKCTMRFCPKESLCETLKWKSSYLCWMITWEVSCCNMENSVVHSVFTRSDTLAASPRIMSGIDTPTDESSNDYVWDVFYHRPASLSEWNSVAARTGTMCVYALLKNLSTTDSGNKYRYARLTPQLRWFRHRFRSRRRGWWGFKWWVWLRFDFVFPESLQPRNIIKMIIQMRTMIPNLRVVCIIIISSGVGLITA